MHEMCNCSERFGNKKITMAENHFWYIQIDFHLLLVRKLSKCLINGSMVVQFAQTTFLLNLTEIC